MVTTIDYIIEQIENRGKTVREVNTEDQRERYGGRGCIRKINFDDDSVPTHFAAIHPNTNVYIRQDFSNKILLDAIKSGQPIIPQYITLGVYGRGNEGIKEKIRFDPNNHEFWTWQRGIFSYEAQEIPTFEHIAKKYPHIAGRKNCRYIKKSLAGEIVINELLDYLESKDYLLLKQN